MARGKIQFPNQEHTEIYGLYLMMHVICRSRNRMA